MRALLRSSTGVREDCGDEAGNWPQEFESGTPCRLIMVCCPPYRRSIPSSWTPGVARYSVSPPRLQHDSHCTGRCTAAVRWFGDGT
jgi:hypothetical protein